jgi:hypothetical protein
MAFSIGTALDEDHFSTRRDIISHHVVLDSEGFTKAFALDDYLPALPLIEITAAISHGIGG